MTWIPLSSECRPVFVYYRAGSWRWRCLAHLHNVRPVRLCPPGVGYLTAAAANDAGRSHLIHEHTAVAA